MNKNVLSLKLKEYLFFNIILISILLILMGKENVITYSICMLSYSYAVYSGGKISQKYNINEIIKDEVCYFWLRVLLFFKIPLGVLSLYSILAIFLPLPLPQEKQNYYDIVSNIYILLMIPSLFWMACFIDKKIPLTKFKIINIIIVLLKRPLIVMFSVAVFFVIIVLFLDNETKTYFFVIVGILSSLMLSHLASEVMEEKMGERFSFKNKIKIATPYCISLLVALLISVILANII